MLLLFSVDNSVSGSHGIQRKVASWWEEKKVRCSCVCVERGRSGEGGGEGGRRGRKGGGEKREEGRGGRDEEGGGVERETMLCYQVGERTCSLVTSCYIWEMPGN